MLQTIVGALLPVVVTQLLGVLAGWRGDQNAKAAGTFNRMVLVYALPLLLFAGTATTSREALARELPLAFRFGGAPRPLRRSLRRGALRAPPRCIGLRPAGDVLRHLRSPSPASRS